MNTHIHTYIKQQIREKANIIKRVTPLPRGKRTRKKIQYNEIGANTYAC